MDQGIGSDDPEDFLCEDYTEDEIKNDREAVDWEEANQEVERIEEQKRQAQIEFAKEQERLRIESLYLEQQKADKEKEERMLQQIAEKEEIMKQEREQRE